MVILKKSDSGVRALAKETGYSVATISRVLNGSSAVKKATREKVLEAARQQNYFPNPMARALATNRTRVIGAVIPTIEHSIFATFIRAIEETVGKNGYSLVIALTNFDMSIEKTRAFQLMNMGAEALIVSGLAHDQELLDGAAARGVPVLCTSIYNAEAELPTIGYDNYGLGVQAAGFLRNLGHQKIGVIFNDPRENDRTTLRLEGVQSVLGNGDNTAYTVAQFSVNGGGIAARQLFEETGLQPTAILCLSDVLALGVLFEAQRLHLNIPLDLSLMGFDDLEWSSATSPPLTTIQLPVIEMGKTTAEVLIDHLENGTHLTSRLMDSSALIVRGSTRKLVKK